MKTSFIFFQLMILALWVNAQKVIQGDSPKDKIRYTCSPCGCEYDSVFFDAAGLCPGCSMPLQKVTAGEGPHTSSNESSREISNHNANQGRKKVAALLYDHVIQIDYVPASGIFMAAGQMSDFEVYTIGLTDTIVSMGGERILPRYTLQNAPKPDIMIVPGGEWAKYDRESHLIKYIVEQHSAGTIILSVCTGAYLLAKAGLLDDLESTSLHVQLDLLQKLAPKTKVVKRDFVDNGSIITAAGDATGIDAALSLLARVSGPEKARWVAEVYMDYRYYQPPVYTNR